MIIVGQEQIADLFGVAAKTIVEWQEQGLPVAERGRPGVPSKYDSADCVMWLVNREVKKACVETPSDRLARVKADQIEMANAKERGQLIPADLIEPRITAAITAAREHLDSAAPGLAEELLGLTVPEIETKLETVFREFLEHFATWNQEETDVDLGAEDE